MIFLKKFQNMKSWELGNWTGVQSLNFNRRFPPKKKKKKPLHRRWVGPTGLIGSPVQSPVSFAKEEKTKLYIKKEMGWAYETNWIPGPIT